VIFTTWPGGEAAGYGDMADSMIKLAATQPGYPGIESTRDETGLGITVRYWKDHAALASWKQVAAHLIAQKSGRDRWYEHYTLRLAKVERAYEGPEGRG
jgi:heme-degrading monooxygenase HmoA